MKIPSMSLAVGLTAGIILTAALSQKAYCADENKKNADNMGVSSAVRKIEAEIDADREKIIEEGKAIKADRRKLKESEEIADKAKSEQIKQELSQDIKKREAAIKDLKKGIDNKKYRRNDLVYGKTVIPSRSHEAK